MASKTKYYRVNVESGAFIDDLYFAKDEVVALDISALKKDENGKPKDPEWGVEVDKDGYDVEKDDDRQLAEAPAARLGGQLADSIAARASTGNGGRAGAKGQAGRDPNLEDEKGEGSTGGGNQLSEDQKKQVKESLGLLDPADATHWTSRGLPNTETVSSVLGFPVERKDINDVAPDFTKDVAIKTKSETKAE